jgi:membrane protein implicated in regulation of membrane protease activity
MVLPIQAGASNPAALDPVARIDGPFWTWVVPIALFAVALGATLLLYRHFVSRSEEDR